MIFKELTLSLQSSTIIQNYLEWLKNILKYTGLSFGSIFLFLFIAWVIFAVFISLLQEFPIFKGFLKASEFLLFPGTIMHSVWRVFVLKKLNYSTEQVTSFSFGRIRFGIRIRQPFKSMRDSVLFFYAPALNVFVIIIWIMPGALLFEWLDSLIGQTVFYWIWFYILVSLTIMGLPSIWDLVAPLETSIVKTPEFYIFVIFYVILAPLTLVLWGWGITVIFSLFYAITAIYEVEKISRKETHRLSLAFDKFFAKGKSKTKSATPQIIITDKEL